LLTKMRSKTESTRILKGKPTNLIGPAPSFRSKLLAGAAREYRTLSCISNQVYYLISDTPISEFFWKHAGYSSLEFEYEGKTRTLNTNHGSTACMRAVIDGTLDISDFVFDLVCLIAPILGKDRFPSFEAEVRAKVINGLERELITDR
jgi:hypothetical protein